MAEGKDEVLKDGIFKIAGKDGTFKRQVSSFRSWVSTEPGAEFPPESNRYVSSSLQQKKLMRLCRTKPSLALIHKHGMSLGIKSQLSQDFKRIGRCNSNGGA